MSAEFYNRMAATAARLLKKFGQEVTITRVTNKTTDPVTGHVTPGQTQTFAPSGILKPYPDALVDGTRIKASDRLLILDSTVEPQMSDKVTLKGEQWPIQGIKTASPAGTALVYFLQVRK